MTTLRGIFPDPKPVGRKNFIHENVRNLRRMEHCFHMTKDLDEFEKLNLQKQHKITDKYQNVTSRISTNIRDKKYGDNAAGMDTTNKKQEHDKINRKCSAPSLSKNNAALKKGYHSCRNENLQVKQKRRDKRPAKQATQKLKGEVLSDPSLSHEPHNETECNANAQARFKSQAIQTLDLKEMDDIYLEGSIKYASEKPPYKTDNDTDKQETPEQLDSNIKEILSPLSARGDERSPEHFHQETDSKQVEALIQKSDIDFIKLNKERASVASKMAAHLNSNGILPNTYKKGIVPKYIRDRKEAQEKEQRDRADALDPDCPEGHIALPDSERKDTLRMLKKNYQDYVCELNKMPIKSDTLRAQKRKMEIEKQLTKLEEGIKVFSRPKVYVKVNA